MREIITGSDVDAAHKAGQQEIVVPEGSTVTAIARERAEKLGLHISISAEGGIAFRPSTQSTGRRNVTAPPAPVGSQQASRTGSSSVPGYDMNAWRKKFPILKSAIHVANCSQSPQCDATREAALGYLDNWNGMGMDWDRWMEEIALAKSEFARLINAELSEIAIGTSISELTSTIASSLPLDTGRTKVVTTDAEFPTVANVWNAFRKYGLEPVSSGQERGDRAGGL